MAVEIKLPVLGEGVDSGTVAGVLVATGDTVEVDAPLIELETDKAVIEVPASEAGVVASLPVKAGDTVAVGQVIATIEPASPPAPEAPAEEPAAEQPRRQAPPPPVPERPAVQTAPPAPSPPGPPPARPPAAPAPSAQTSADEFNLPEWPIPATPNTRRFARELGVDITAVQGTGNGGRILSGDVVRTARSLLEAAAAGGAAPAPPPLPDFSRWGEVEREPMSGIRRTTATHLSTSWTTIPHVTQHDDADITELEQLRKRFGPRVQEAGGKLTMTAIAVRVVASALRVFPRFASSVDMASREVILKRYTHVGVAVDTERGLLVPVLRDADRKNATELSVELGVLAARARDGKLTLEEMQGGCFTITNLGGLGGTSFTPIVNYPEVAILGMSRSRVTPVHRDGGFEPRLMLPLSLSYDHRVIDGADAVRFLRWIVEALEDPFLLSLEG
jgi:pyruvate dehydrogenase E2 component (dihydrolipoamide acetyltransferase)